MSDLRDLPSVDEALRRLERLTSMYPRALVTEEVRRAIEAARAAIRAGNEPEPVEAAVQRALERLDRPSQRPVINATGVVLHTNLGRAPIGRYVNLEYDIATGRRGNRDTHIAPLIEKLLGAPGIAVNNNAAAIYLTLRELAAGGEVVISRGELIEIGDGFRIPDIMEQSGAILREVGTTNRTTVEDYRRAINDRTRLLLRVHPSNFRIVGFTARPTVPELAALARETGVPLYEDLGSGCVMEAPGERPARESLEAGADLVSFSGDKLLGGPQAGIIAGRADLVARLRRNPMYRALRLDKVILQLLEATLRSLLFERWDAVPALRLIRRTPDELRARAERIAAEVPGAEVVEGRSVIGGGSTPDQTLPTWLIALGGDVVAREAALRANDPPIIARIENGRLVIDLRTVFEDEEAALLEALKKL
ncbi:MAG: L-seryl-tRNA(Sec) selenium transferase [bacterium]